MADEVVTFKEGLVFELYKKGEISIGKASEMLGKNIEEMKVELHKRGIERRTSNDINKINEMAEIAAKLQVQ